VKDLVIACKAVFSKYFPTINDNADYTSIINDRQYQRLLGHIEDARTKGATIVEINPANEKLDPAKRKLPLTLILNPTDEMICMQEEIFGPVLPILNYGNLDEALQYIRDRPHPLALYFFGYNKAEQNKVLHNSISGGMCLNDTLMHVSIDDMSFGGIGPSGIGNYHGYQGFKELSNAKGVLSRPRYNSMKLLYPPYNRFLHKIMKKWLVN